jgi:hypothetical protein
MISADCDEGGYMMEVDRRGQDTATVVIAVGVGDINLALRKPATESSTYTYSIPVAASYALQRWCQFFY